jgi:lipid-binding SYLF domain-containing protein
MKLSCASVSFLAALLTALSVFLAEIGHTEFKSQMKKRKARKTEQVKTAEQVTPEQVTPEQVTPEQLKTESITVI